MSVPGLRPDITSAHYVPWNLDMQLDLDVFGAGWMKRKVDRGAGVSSFQGNSSTCAIHAVNNLAESWGLPVYDVHGLYRNAKALDDVPNDHIQAGTRLGAAAEAWCRQHTDATGRVVRWSSIPAVDEYVAKYIVAKGAVAVGMRWYMSDFNPGFANILERGVGRSTAGHAVLYYGFDPAYTFSRYPFLKPFDFFTAKLIRKRTNLANSKTVRAFLGENSQTAFHKVRIVYGRLGELDSDGPGGSVVPVDGLEAIIFIP